MPSTTWGARALPAAGASTSVATSVTTSYDTTLRDTFTGEATGTDVRNHVADSGAEWSRHPAYSTVTLQTSSAGRVYAPTGAFAYVSSAVPASSDYTVSALLRRVGAVTTDFMGIAGRMAATANTAYLGYYNPGSGDQTAQWELYSIVAGTFTLLGSAAEILSQNSDYEMRLVLSGTSVRLVVNENEKIAVDNSAITVAGFTGIRGNAVAAQTDIFGLHMDDFVVRGFVGVTTASVTTTSAWSQRAVPSTAWTARA